MKQIARCALLVAVAGFFLMVKPFWKEPIAVRAQDQNVQTIAVTAKKYEFSPSPIRVKAGTKVQLKITALDHDHGFKVTTVAEGSGSESKPGLVFDSPQDCFKLKKGQTTTIEFLAQTAGSYAFRCCHVCGFGHKGMKGQIIVE